jgi:prepilin-type N-terminal cleavage/methylation domain-containing protein
MNILSGMRGNRTERGFTAIEVSAVATIIAILALILIPIVRNRVAEARLVAAADDMATIEKAQSLAFGYTGLYFGLMDLEQGDPNLLTATWNKPLGATANIEANWKGPYMAMHNTRTVSELVAERPYLFRGLGGSGGPILVYQGDVLKRMPIDPWGSPYLFFGDDKVGDDGSANVYSGTETDFNVPIIFSLGPNGAPGDLVGFEANVQLYFREAAVLGTGDDLLRNF